MSSLQDISKPQKDSLEDQITQLKQSLPKQQWFNGTPLYLYQGFWINILDSIVALQNHFQARDTEVLVTSCRKAGTTWLKALTYSICYREKHPLVSSPLLDHNPHELVRQFESNIYMKSTNPDLNTLKCPRLFGTHVPFASLPSSIKTSKCKIVYIARNPLDTLVSSWTFYQKFTDNQSLSPDMLHLYIDMFAEGKTPFGPYEDHVLGYWKKSLESPEKVLFIKYEDLKADAKSQVKLIAEFLGYPFSIEEESKGVIDDIIELCSFQKLKQASEPGKSATVYSVVSNDSFFRKGVVGDWVNFISPSIADKFNEAMAEKF